MKWIEVNIGVEKDPDIMRTVLLEFVDPLVEKTKSKVHSWHFLWESKPWPEVKKIGTTLRLRFYGEDNRIEKLREEIENELDKLEREKLKIYFGHCFGRHGDCGDEYEGEDWGTEGWELGMEILKFGSEVAIKLIKNKMKLGKSIEYKLPMGFYADRYVHCFLNNVFSPSEEMSFHLQQAVQRISYSFTGKMFEKDELTKIMNEIYNKVINKAKNTKQ